MMFANGTHYKVVAISGLNGGFETRYRRNDDAITVSAHTGPVVRDGSLIDVVVNCLPL